MKYDEDVEDENINDELMDVFNFMNEDDDDEDEEDDEDDEDDEETIKHVIKKQTNNKPKLIGKHSLSYDVIFKGKKNSTLSEYEEGSELIIKNAGGSLDINDDVLDFEETKSNMEYFRDVRLKEEIYKILNNHTDINFIAARRKPSVSDFNAYYRMILKDLFEFGYTKSEIFIELSGYFSDNIWNIFVLLENKYSNIIINELKEKYGLSDINKIQFL